LKIDSRDDPQNKRLLGSGTDGCLFKLLEN